MATPRRGVGVQREAVAAETITFPIIVGIVHFLLVQVIATLAYRYGTIRESSPPDRDVFGEPERMSGIAHWVVEPLRQWDGLWYKLIADRGYESFSANAAFWPLFPWLMRLGHDVTGLSSETIGYLIANASFFGALIVLYKLITIDFDREIARRTLIALAFFPMALFFTAVYTESLFLLLAVAALYCARTERWFAAGIYGLLAALTRSQGVLLLAPFAVLFLQQHRFEWRRWFPNLVYAGLPALGPVIFGWFLRRAGYGWFAFVDVQEQWARSRKMPWETLQEAREKADWGWIRALIDDPTWSNLTSFAFRDRFARSDTIELICTVLFFAVAIVGLRLLPFYQSAYLWPALVIPLFEPSVVHPLFSIPRFGIVLFPLFVVAALLVRTRRVAVPALAISAVLLVIFTAQFAQWYWVS